MGPTSVYAFMQNVGVVNDHVHGCFRATDYRPTASSPWRSKSLKGVPMAGLGCSVYEAAVHSVHHYLAFDP